ncbi:MAG: OB-fold nucleic acid binding domain-containing protein, partial [Nitrospiraceae bacterium]|nr:OB-fold nucleic acid binding domain-containing protein [Nitrospiraceae bacterium]
MEETNELIKQRIRKVEELKEMGVKPYGDPFCATDHAADLLEKYQDTAKEELEAGTVECSLAGRIVAMRDFGKAAFAHVQDGTGRMQIYLKKDVLGEGYKLLKKLDIGDIVGLKGRLFRTKTNELTVEVTALRLMTKSIRPLPEKWHGLKDVETRYRQRYVDLIVTPEVRENFARRS